MLIRPHQINFLDSHRNFEKMGQVEYFYLLFFIILTALKKRMVLKETFDALKSNCQIE